MVQNIYKIILLLFKEHKLKKIKHYELWIKFINEENINKKKKIEKQLVEIYYPLVRKIAYGLAPKINWKLTPDELSSFGVDGLYIAINRFDITREFKFETYASLRIRGSMLDGIRREDVIPRSVRINNKSIERTKDLLESEKCRKVFDYEILEELDIEYEEYHKNIKKFHPVSYSSIEGSDICSENTQDTYHQDTNSNLKDNKVKSSDNYIIRKEFRNKLIGKGFSELEQKILSYYYYKNLTMDRIAEKLDMSESRISQIHKSLLPRLKDKILRNPKYFNNDIYKIIQSCNSKTPFE